MKGGGGSIPIIGHEFCYSRLCSEKIPHKYHLDLKNGFQRSKKFIIEIPGKLHLFPINTPKKTWISYIMAKHFNCAMRLSLHHNLNMKIC